MKPGYEIKDSKVSCGLTPQAIVQDNYHNTNIIRSYSVYSSVDVKYLVSEETVAVFKIKLKP